MKKIADLDLIPDTRKLNGYTTTYRVELNGVVYGFACSCVTGELWTILFDDGEVASSDVSLEVGVYRLAH